MKAEGSELLTGEKLLEKPTDGISYVFSVLAALISYSMWPDLLVSIPVLGISLLFTWLYNRRKKNPRPFASVNSSRIHFYDIEMDFFWNELHSIYQQKRQFTSPKSDEEILQLVFTDHQDHQTVLDISSLQCDLDELHEALKNYCPVYISEESGVQQSLLFDLRNSSDPAGLANTFNRCAGRTSAGALISLIPVVSGGILQYYLDFYFVFSMGLMLAIAFHCINIEWNRNRFIRACTEQGLSSETAEEVIRTYGSNLNYDNTGNRWMFYAVMALGVAMAFIIQYGILHE